MQANLWQGITICMPPWKAGRAPSRNLWRTGQNRRRRRQMATAAPALYAGGQKRHTLKPAHTPEPFVCLHVAGGKSYKHWPRAHFARLADELERQGLRVVLIGGPADREAVDEVKRLSRTVSIDLAGKIPIGQLIAVLEESRLFIGNDSGPMHSGSRRGHSCRSAVWPDGPGPLAPTDRSAYAHPWQHSRLT